MVEVVVVGDILAAVVLEIRLQLTPAKATMAVQVQLLQIMAQVVVVALLLLERMEQLHLVGMVVPVKHLQSVDQR